MARSFTVNKLHTGYGLGSPAPSYVMPANNIGQVRTPVGPAAASSQLASEADSPMALRAPHPPRPPRPGIRRIRVRRPRLSPKGAGFSLPSVNANY